MIKKNTFCGGFALCFIAWSSPLWASSISVSPTRLDITTQERTAIAKVTNVSDEPIVMQLEVMAWSQEDGEDIYTKSKDIIATPPLVKIDPQSQQVVRLRPRKVSNSTTETPYRLFLTEIPQVSKAQKSGIQTTLRIGVPVFIKPMEGLKAKPVASATWDRKNKIEITVVNKGTAHFKTSKLSLKANDKTLVEKEALTYILPSKMKRWVFDLPASFNAHKISVSMDTAEGPVSIPLTLPPR